MLSIIVFSILIFMAVSSVGYSLAQTQDTWKTYTSDECNVTFQYPGNWILKTKQGTFDTNTTYLIAFYDPAVNLTDNFPAFGLQACMDVDVLNTLIKVMKSYPTYGKTLPIGNVTDVKSLGLTGEALTAYISNGMSAVGSLINSFGNKTFDVPQFTVVEHTSVKPKLIGGEDVAVFTTLVKIKSLNVGTRNYAVIHNGITYSFSFSDDPGKFDLPENTKIRQRILESIQFMNGLTQ